MTSEQAQPEWPKIVDIIDPIARPTGDFCRCSGRAKACHECRQYAEETLVKALPLLRAMYSRLLNP